LFQLRGGHGRPRQLAKRGVPTVGIHSVIPLDLLK
jgi:hypothetical protein